MKVSFCTTLWSLQLLMRGLVTLLWLALAVFHHVAAYSQAEIEEIMSEMDRDKDGKLSFEELLGEEDDDDPDIAHLKKAVAEGDVNNNGGLDIEELPDFFEAMHHALDEDPADYEPMKEMNQDEM
mmetsp:Transcript_51957/g.97452  ORF Transcript_51957/g.97452 Transcript_51957/m.97452 type:complete len:125 (-) Transcript_51957:197-571(-)